MGNFGKRVLIVTLSVLAVVALTLAGNAYQQSSKNHKVSGQKEVVYSGVYNGTSYQVTKKDIWEGILSSDPMGTIEEIIDKKLLQVTIDGISDTDERIQDKKNELIFGSSDSEVIANYYEADGVTLNAQGEKAKLSFESRMALLGYDKTEEGYRVEDYCKLLIARDIYAAWRINEGKNIGSYKFDDLKDEKLKEEYLKSMKDTLAVAVKFYSEDDYKTFLKAYNTKYNTKFEVVSSKIRYYVGDQDAYVEAQLATNASNSIYVNDSFEVVTTMQNGHAVPKNTNNLAKDSEGNFIWDTNVDAWQRATQTIYAYKFVDGVQTSEIALYENGEKMVIELDKVIEETAYKVASTTTDGVTTYSYTVKDTDNDGIGDTFDKWTTTGSAFVANEKKDYADQTSFTTSNCAMLNPNQYLTLYVALFNEYYAQYRNELTDNNITLADIKAAFTTYNEEAFVEYLKENGYVLVEDEVRLYVGNDAYRVKVENGEALSEYGVPTYETVDISGTKTKVPTQKIIMKDGQYSITDKKFDFELDGNGKKQDLDSKLAIDKQTVFDKTNTIAVAPYQLYALYHGLYGNFDNLTAEYNAYMEGVSSYITYNYEEFKAAREKVATALFTTLKVNDSSAVSYLETATKYDGANSYETPYYLIFKLTSSVTTEPSEAKLAELKAKKVEKYLNTANIANMAMAELRGEAGLKIYDEFFCFDYQNSLKLDKDKNPAGSSEYKDYFKKKAYNANKLVSLKKVNVMGTTVEKFKVTANDLYEYATDHFEASLIVTAALNNMLLNMPQFEEIHGKSTNYLTSKNWKMQSYAFTTQYYNYQYEYYKNMYAQYGLDYGVSSVKEFVYQYGFRTFDEMVVGLQRATMRNIFLYNYFVGNLDSTELSQKGAELFNSAEFNDIYNNFYSINVNHVLVYVDYDEDGAPDNYDDFMAEFDSTGNHSFLKNADGTALTLTQWTKALNKLQAAILEKVYESTTFSASSMSALTEFITDYNKSSRVDGDYKDYKGLGIMLNYETLGEITNVTSSKYVEAFQNALVEVQEKLYRTDNDLLGYTIADKLYPSQFGAHYIFAKAGENFDKPTFKFADEKGLYANGLENTTDVLTEKQFALYLQQMVYSYVYGTDAEAEKNAGFDYPNLPQSFTKAVELYFGTQINLVMDANSAYNANYLMCSALASDSTPFAIDFQKLQNIYYNLVYGELSK